MTKIRIDQDTPWKDILDAHFKDILELCYPKVAKAIDWSRGYALLDKELNAVIRQTKTGKRFVDKLIKVWQTNGEEIWILIHIEIRGQEEAELEQLMFTNHYRLFGKYQCPIMSLAILLDEKANWRPHVYEYKLGDCRLRFEFASIKLLDFKGRESELKRSSNPFAWAILSHLKSMNSGGDLGDVLRFKTKYSLNLSLYKKDWNRETILNLQKFLDWSLTLPEPLELEYVRRVKRYEEKNNMAYMTSFERVGRNEGLKQGLEQGWERGLKDGMQRGLEKGLKQGIKQGFAQGTQEGEWRILLLLLEQKFGPVPLKFKRQIKTASSEVLMHCAERILYANTLGDMFDAVFNEESNSSPRGAPGEGRLV